MRFFHILTKDAGCLQPGGLKKKNCEFLLYIYLTVFCTWNQTSFPSMRETNLFSFRNHRVDSNAAFFSSILLANLDEMCGRTNKTLLFLAGKYIFSLSPLSHRGQRSGSGAGRDVVTCSGTHQQA